MRTSCVKNVLVVGVILLFIGVGFQPAFAVTKDRNNNPPDAPEIYGPVRWPVNVEIEFSFSSTDPEGDDVKYYIEWGDGKDEETYYYQSGEIVTVFHIYEETETYLLRAKAIDIYDCESEWSSYYIPIYEDDCNLCPKVSNQHLVRLENLLNKIYKYDNILSALSKNYPEIAEKYQELSKRITTFKKMNKELKQIASGDKNTNLCDLLHNISLSLLVPYAFYRGFSQENDYPILNLILFPFIVVTTAISIIFMIIWRVFCYKGQI